MAFMKRRLKPWYLFQHTMRVSLFLRVLDSLPHGAQKLKSVILAFICLFLRALPDIDASKHASRVVTRRFFLACNFRSSKSFPKA